LVCEASIRAMIHYHPYIYHILRYLFKYNYCLILNPKVLCGLVVSPKFLEQEGMGSSARSALFFTWAGSGAGQAQ
jgi:hypothetical protein